MYCIEVLSNMSWINPKQRLQSTVPFGAQLRVLPFKDIQFFKNSPTADLVKSSLKLPLKTSSLPSIEASTQG